MTGTIAEICCGSYYDAKQAALGGAGRIELNSALMLGGLTPTETTLHMIKEEFPSLKVVAMVRPRMRAPASLRSRRNCFRVSAGRCCSG